MQSRIKQSYIPCAEAVFETASPAAAVAAIVIVVVEPSLGGGLTWISSKGEERPPSVAEVTK